MDTQMATAPQRPTVTPRVRGFTICPASPNEADDLARLAVLASDGLTLATWADIAAEDQTPIQIGAARAARTEGSFSYRNADIAMQNRNVIAAIISYPMTNQAEVITLADVPPVFRPLVALEARATPSWYINILATYPDARGQGAATALIEDVEARAKLAGFAQLSLIVGNNNSARRLYGSLGFSEAAREAVVQGDTPERDTHWILIKKSIN